MAEKITVIVDFSVNTVPALFLILYLFLLICDKRRAKKQKDVKAHESFPFLFLFSFWVNIIIAQRDSDLFRFVLHLLIFLSLCVCAIIHRKIRMRASAQKIMDELVLKIEDIRRKLTKINGWMNRYRIIVYLLSFLLLLIGVLSHSAVASLTILAILWIASAIYGMNSCRRLLVFWCGSIIVAWITIKPMLKNLVVSDSDIEPSNIRLISEILFTILLMLIWTCSILFVDDEVGKMAALIVNSGTTIWLILSQIITAYAKYQSPEINTFPLELSDLELIFPFVVSGYIAFLFKEVQIFWKKKYHPDEIEGKS